MATNVMLVPARSVHFQCLPVPTPSFASQILYLTATWRKGLVSVVGQSRFCGIHLRFAVISENIIKIDVNSARVNYVNH